MSRVLTVIASATVLLVSAIPAAAVGIPAGTAIDLVVGADFRDSQDVSRSSVPATKTLYVTQIAGVDVRLTPYTNGVGASETIYVPVQFVNVGNGTDWFGLAVTAPAGWQADLVYDFDDDGLHGEYDDAEVDETGLMLQDAYAPCLIRVTSPPGVSEAATMVVTATSGFDGEVFDSSVLGLVAREEPTIRVTGPTSDTTFARNSSSLWLRGTAVDNTWVAGVRWSNDTTGTSGSCDLNGTEWSISDIPLDLGDNVVSLVATDSEGAASSISLNVTYVDASPGDQWRGMSMVSIPLIPDESDPIRVVPFDQSYWCSFDTLANAYSRYPDANTFLLPLAETPVRGFWTHVSVSEFPNPVGTIPCQDEPVTIHLSEGWNLIGQPFIRPVLWDLDAILVQRPGNPALPMRDSATAVSNFAWGWSQDATDPDTGAYYLVCDPDLIEGAVGQMDPWQGYWIRALKTCDLILPPP